MKRHLIFFLAFITGISASAQNDIRSWAIDATIGPTIIKSNDALGVDNGVVLNLGVEYYIPDSHFCAKFGYQSETINLLAQDIQANHSQFALGGRWYPAPEKWMIQPRLGVDMDLLLSSDNTSAVSIISSPYTFSYAASIRSPKVVFVPTAGLDLYIFSSVAFSIDYSYSIGFNSRYKIYKGTSNKSPLISKGNLNHSNLNFGVKVVFPFRFNSDDARGLIQSLFLSSFTSAYNKR